LYEFAQKDGLGNCIKEETGREDIDSRGIKEYTPPAPEEKTHDYFTPTLINPATGLPILENGLDALGNQYGFNVEAERLAVFENDAARLREIEKVEQERNQLIEQMYREERERIQILEIDAARLRELEMVEQERRQIIEQMLRDNSDKEDRDRNDRRMQEERALWSGQNSFH
jgi:hypothetical protein